MRFSQEKWWIMKQQIPQFPDGAILRAKTLENLRDYSYFLPQLARKGYSDGIISGMELSSQKNTIEVGTGLFLARGEVFYLNSPWKLDISPSQELMILKLRSEAPEYVKNAKEFVFSLVLDAMIPSESEFELCRFKLEEGAVLRDRYVDFRDISTEYDTINLQFAPYSGYSAPTVHVQVLWLFAEELLEQDDLSSLDQNFALNILSRRESLSFSAIQGYLRQKLQIKVDTLEKAYDSLHTVLRLVKNRETKVPEKATSTRAKIFIE